MIKKNLEIESEIKDISISEDGSENNNFSKFKRIFRKTILVMPIKP